jgi:hypothetical protein
MKYLLNLAFFSLIIAISGDCASQTPNSGSYAKQTQLYIGNGACNNGEITISEKHKGCSTLAIGYTIDAADAISEGGFVELFAGNDVMNNGIVSPDNDHGGGSTQSIGYLSKKPIRGGKRILAGNQPCNNGIATLSHKHLGCGTKIVGYALPQKQTSP